MKYEQEIVSSVCLSRGSLVTTVVAFYHVKTNTTHYYSFKDNVLHEFLFDVLKEEKITTIIIQKEAANLINLLKKDFNLICVDRKTFSMDIQLPIEEYFSNCTISSLLNYLNLDNFTTKELKIRRKHVKSVMFIPEKVIKDLDLLGSTPHSFFNLVNFTKTRFGVNKLKTNIVQPFTDKEKIYKRHKNILYFKNNDILVAKLENILKNTPFILNSLTEDVSVTKGTLQGLKRTAEESKRLNLFISKCVELRKVLPEDLSVGKTFLETFDKSKIIKINEKFALFFELNTIRPGIDDYLDLARKIYNELFGDITKIADEIVKSTDLKLIKTSRGVYLKIQNKTLLEQPDLYSFNKDFSFDKTCLFEDNELTDLLNLSSVANVCSLTTENSKLNKKSEFLLLVKNKLYSLVVTKEIYKLNLLLGSIYNQMVELEGEIALNLFKEVNDDLFSLLPLCEIIAEIDVCLSGYKFSRSFGCCIPKICDILCISNSFYPPLKSSVHNDYYSDQDSLLNIITGPNMSGKSTYLKQLAYLSILAQIGYPLTAKFAVIKIYTSLYVSFNSVRIDFHRINNLLENHTTSSLIIIDEPGKGYDTHILTAFYSVLFRKLLICKPTIFFITHHYGIYKLVDLNNVNFLSVEDFKVRFGIRKTRKGLKICEETLQKIYLDWL